MCDTVSLPGVAVVRRLRDDDAVLLSLEGGVCSDEGTVRQPIRPWIGAS